MQNKPILQVVKEILKENPEIWIIYHCMSEQDMETAMLWEHAMVCSDSWSYPVNAPKQIAEPHPRSYGAFTRFLERFAVKNTKLSLSEAIHKMTAKPARFLNIVGRGEIKEGYYADLVLIDLAKLKDKATFANPRQYSEGVIHLWVNGVLTIENGQLSKNHGGTIIKAAR